MFCFTSTNPRSLYLSGSEILTATCYSDSSTKVPVAFLFWSVGSVTFHVTLRGNCSTTVDSEWLRKLWGMGLAPSCHIHCPCWVRKLAFLSLSLLTTFTPGRSIFHSTEETTEKSREHSHWLKYYQRNNNEMFSLGSRKVIAQPPSANKKKQYNICDVLGTGLFGKVMVQVRASQVYTLSEVMQSIAHLAHCGPWWDALFLPLTDIDTSRTDVCRSITCGHFSLWLPHLPLLAFITFVADRSSSTYTVSLLLVKPQC